MFLFIFMKNGDDFGRFYKIVFVQHVSVGKPIEPDNA